MKIDMTPDEAKTVVATICGTFEPIEVSEVIFVVTRKCPKCEKHQITTIFGTPNNDTDAIEMLLHAISRINQEGLFDV